MGFFRATFASVFLHTFISIRLVAGLLLLTTSATYAETVSLQHDNHGNFTQRSTIFGTTTYTYDARDRLISESGPAKTQSFTYDANGNRLSDGSGTYTYSPSSNHMATQRGLAVTYDATGNITSDGTGRTYTYNGPRQLSQVFQNGVLIASYYYDGFRQRTRKVTTAAAPQGAQTIIYIHDQWGKIIGEFTETGTPLRSYIWADGRLIAQIEEQPPRKIYYFMVDHLNTPRVILDEAGKVVWRWESDAFGNTLPDEDPDKDGVKTTTNLRFGGDMYYDQESGLFYNWNRYYDPSTGRYTQPDPIGMWGGTNPYTYAQSNPLRWTDPYGLLDKSVNWFLYPKVKDAAADKLNKSVPSDTPTIPGKDRQQTIDELSTEIANQITEQEAKACLVSATARKTTGQRILGDLKKIHPDYPWQQWAPYFEKVWE